MSPSTTLTGSNPRSTRQLRLGFYALWFLISLVQAAGTELFDDEAYYWVYSRFLDWGYFDHPPMIAVLIKLGTTILPGELGLRFFIVLMGTATIALIEYLTQPKDIRLFFAIVLNMAVLQIGGIIAVPDIPLLFFTALFFISYQAFEQKNTIISALLLAIVIALLLYSKYHGILIIFFTILSNPSILARWKTLLVILLSVGLFMPHVIWQILHGLPSINYHLFERLSPPYNPSFTADYLLGQLLLTGPLVGWLIIWAALKNRYANATEKAMYWSLIGTYVLFFLSSFRSRTEANWTILLMAPLIVLSYQFLSQNKNKARWIYRLLPYSIALVLLVRIYMILDIQALSFMPKDEFHQNKEWAAAIKKKANGLPVVFTNSYQRASKYWFYAGDTSFSLNTHRYRRSNYNFWPMEEQLQGRRTMIFGSMGAAAMKDSVLTPRMQLAAETIDDFTSYGAVQLDGGDLNVDEKGFVNVVLKPDYGNRPIMERARVKHPEIILIIYRSGKQEPILIPTGRIIGHDSEYTLIFRMKLPPLEEKKYTIRWGLKGSFSEPTINSRTYALKRSVTE
jgi:4-amino-4-deoxy-L-arabinose transferase-like glycosyltransferase